MAYRILIVDDDLHTRRILETLLSREPGLGGPEVVTAADGLEALASVEQQRPDLVITDLLMPRMDGFAFARAMRKHPNGEGVPLLVTSAIYKDRVSIGRLEQETSCEFFAKPYQLRDLVRAVLKHLGGPQQRRRVMTRPSPQWPSVQEGALAERPLPRVLIELFDAGATGVLTVTRARLKKDIFIYLGHPIGAESNLRNETLGQMLVARGALEPDKLRQALELARSGQNRLGMVLLEKGWMKEGELLKYLAAQVRLKIVTALRWPDGEYRFLPGDTFSGRMTHLTVDAPRVVFSGLKRSAHVEEIARGAAAGPHAGGRLVVDARFDRHREAFVRVFGEAQLPQLLDRPRPADLVGKNDPELLVQYDALLKTGLGVVEAQTAAFARRAAANASPSRAAARSEALYRQLFGDDEAAAAVPSAPTGVDFDIAEDSGVFALPAPTAADAPPARLRTTDPAMRALHEALLREYLTLHTRDHYELLRVPRGASIADVQAAFALRVDEFRLERFDGMELGRDHARLETLHQAFREAFEVLSDPARRAAYDRALDAPRPENPRPVLEAEAQFREALRLLGADEHLEAVARLREATRLQPDQADYHALLGWALFQARDPGEDLATATIEARGELQQALSIDPDHVAAHEFLGRLLFVVGEDGNAAEHLERALHLDPGRPEALATAEAAYLRMNQHGRLERLYRSQIARLGDARAAQLWWDLAMLLRDHRADRIGAIAALGSYLKLVPEDLRARELLAKLERDSLPPTPPSPAPDYRRAAATLRAAWHASPDDPAPGRALFQLYLGASRPDAALWAASALAVRGAGDADADAYARRYRPRFLSRAIAPATWAQIDSLRHPDDDRDLATLFTRLFAAARPEVPLPPAAARVEPEAVPAPFAQVLGYVTWLLGVASPTVMRDPEAGGAARIVPLVKAPPGEPAAVLVVGPALLALGDKPQLAFHLGRALSAQFPARAHVLSLSSNQLKVHLQAASGIGVRSVELPPEAAALRDRFAATPHLPGEVRPLIEKLSARGAPLNLSRWVRGLLHTAERVGLLAGNDLLTAARVLDDQGTATADLVDFALSDELAAVRESLGLTLSA